MKTSALIVKISRYILVVYLFLSVTGILTLYGMWVAAVDKFGYLNPPRNNGSVEEGMVQYLLEFATNISFTLFHCIFPFYAIAHLILIFHKKINFIQSLLIVATICYIVYTYKSSNAAAWYFD